MELNRTIRINKVLREFNISLEKAINFLKENNLDLQPSPNAKISEREYKLLSLEFGINQKPQLIKKLEKKLNLTLKQNTKDDVFGWGNKATFVIDENNKVIGLNLCLNLIQDISILNDFVDLKYLDIGHNHIKNFETLSNLINIEKLSLNKTNVENLDFLSNSKKINYLSIASNNNLDISNLVKAINLEYLSIQNNDLRNIDFIKNLKNLKTLDVSFNEIEDLSFISSLSKIETLILVSNKIRNFEIIKDLKNLKKLYLGACQIKDISFLNDLKLETLEIGENFIKDYSVLKTLKNLKELRISYSYLEDVKFIAEITNLEYLHINNNNIKSIKFLSKLEKLIYFDVSNNLIESIEEFKFILDIPNLNIKAYGNPCFEENNIILNEENNYLIISNELKKLDDEQIVGSIPEKILLLGNHSSGKSSFMHYLQNENLEYDSDSTHILNIQNYPKNAELPKAIIYDFGGQDFYHGIYNAFLTVNSTILLFWNSKTNFNGITLDSKGRQNVNYNLDYWIGQKKSKNHYGDLIIIQTHSDDSKSIRKSYINDCDAIEEFFISFKKEIYDEFKIGLKFKKLELLKYTLDDIIKKNQFNKNLNNKMSIKSYNFLKHILNSEETHIPVIKNSLKQFYVSNDDERFETELEQLHMQGLILKHKDNVWLKPNALATYFHEKILERKLIGVGKITRLKFEKTIDKCIIELLIYQKVIFYDSIEKEYIIPNYLPLTIDDKKIYELLTFDYKEPNFILKFKNFIPFGFINQLICYFGKNNKTKYYWRDQLIYKTNDDKFRVLIKLDYTSLEISVSIKSVVSKTDVNQIEKSIFTDILDLYWDNKKDYLDGTTKSLISNINIDDINIDNLIDKKLKAEIKHGNNVIDYKKNHSPDDMYISIDGIKYIHHKTLEDSNKTKNKINAYKLANNGGLDFTNVSEQNASLYKNFTSNNQIKEMKKVFISYSRKDVEYKNELKKHLNLLQAFEIADNWSCEEINIGKWDSQIQKELEESDLIIYMLSANFFSSKYILEKEVKVGMDLINQNKEKNILCIIVSDFIGLDKLKNSVENNSKNEIQDSLLNLSNYQYLPYDLIPNNVNNNNEEKIKSLKDFKNSNTIDKALTQITEKILNEFNK